ncbi:MAG: hypothetical protein AB1589_06700 [Cyanobacteriota bacterium]
MKSFKPLLRLTGVIAAVAMATTPVAALAQGNSQPNQARPRISFNQDQQARFEKLQADTIAKINATLSQQQRTQLEAGIQNGQGFKAVTDLSDAQKNQIRTILTDFNNGIGNILTDEQKREIQKFQESQQGQPNQ